MGRNKKNRKIVVEGVLYQWDALSMSGRQLMPRSCGAYKITSYDSR